MYIFEIPDLYSPNLYGPDLYCLDFYTSILYVDPQFWKISLTLKRESWSTWVIRLRQTKSVLLNHAIVDLLYIKKNVLKTRFLVSNSLCI